MSNKVLFCATVDYHFEKFHVPYLKWFQEQGWEVHVAAFGEIKLPYVDLKFNVPFRRFPLHPKNAAAYRQLKSIVEANDYRIIHCHTPMGGVLARLAARRSRKHGTSVIYTAHGFHFCKGAPLLNWLIYYPIERWLARYTDCLLTINHEDYRLATRHRFPAKRIEHVHGVGVDPERYRPVNEARKKELRERFGWGDRECLLFYAAEFNKNKNQRLLIRAVALLKNEFPGVRLLLAGDGPLLERCRRLCKQLGIEHMVHFLGYRTDIDVLLPACDLAVASSLREGLPVNIMEAMSCALPIVATRNRGHDELVHNNKNGWIVLRESERELAERIKELAVNRRLRSKLGAASSDIVSQQYTIHKVLEEKKSIYLSFMGEMENRQWASR